MTDMRFINVLWVYVALTIAAILSMFFPDYSETLSAAYYNEPESWLLSSSWAANTIMGGLVVAWLAGLVGLFRFKAWARTLSLYSTLVSFPIAALAGASLSSALESTLFEASSVIWGAVLALSYFSPVSSRFGR